ncbi:protein zyg-11 homolog B-like isoform X2 [Agrilus planipennis]|uniref:Protein zyg-11 homolog B-like isoform X2 n=1 Tax=Agrilus planipennis TaxID=224129 RepID=A0A1W4WPK6_AGRPL|nr:protein zyg-11 homolog B-like isoform X2 [Agrilus planipennis]XP_018322048.1 protein zyg-11 homolog B-like isoform X2 [Agrilus planipennis]
MYESPNSLQDLCLDTVCDNLLEIFDVFYENVEEEKVENATVKQYGVNKKFKFKDNELFLIKELSEMLFNKLGEKNLICDSTLNLFSAKNTKLQRVKIKSPRKITIEGLKILKEHKLLELECTDLKKFSINSILECLSDWSFQNLVCLNLSRCTFINSQRHSFVPPLTELRNLKSLSVAYTEFNQYALKILCEDLKQLEKLDISGTVVTDLTPLLLLSDKLTSLMICDLRLLKKMTEVVTKLHNLRHLDVSVVYDQLDGTDHTVTEILENYTSLPNLISLDLSGWRELISKDALENYIKTHPHLKYLGIVLNLVAFESPFSDPNDPRFNHDLMIAGLGSENQIKMTLKRHFERELYVQKALYHLFQLTSAFHEARADIFELVLPSMAAHPNKFGVQMAATACLYNLTRGENSKHIHPKLLSRGVNLTLSAMEHFPGDYQLQKNSLLTLCSDRILQEVAFDKFRCAKLVLDSLCAFDEVNMNRMAVAICSILAAKISTKETSELGARPIYMKKLLAMVQNRVETNLADITLKFTLSALWNLTDESAATCTVFLEQGGASLFMNVLKTFQKDSAIETKVLGLLNNIAEVKKLRHSLMLNSLIEELNLLLKSEHMDVSYFAAGIIAHLASDGPAMWTVTNYSREQMLSELEKVVSNWKVPENEMVAYRSFRPFFPLLIKDMDYRVQLWAVWAIRHVCTKNRYIKLAPFCRFSAFCSIEDL